MRRTPPLFALSAAAVLTVTAGAFAQTRINHLLHDLPNQPVAAPDAAAAGVETGDQATVRKKYISDTERDQHRRGHAHGKQITAEERRLAERHWNLAMRLERIRSIALNLGDAATATRADQLLVDLDNAYYPKLDALNAKAPAVAAADGGP